MSQVFLSGAHVDVDVVRRVRKALLQAGLTVWDPESDPASSDDGLETTLLREISSAECVVVLWSKGAAQSKWIQWEVSQAVNAWASDRLVLAAIDDTALPVGLRDLSPVKIESRSNSGTQELVERVKSIVAPKPAPATGTKPLSTPPPAAWSYRPIVTAAAAVLVITFLILIATSRNPAPSLPAPAPVPRSLPPLLRRVPIPAYSRPLLVPAVALVIGAMIGAGAIWAWTTRSKTRPSPAPPGAMTEPVPSAMSPQVFVSYSHLDARTVEDLVRLLEGMGYLVWIDRASTGAQRYAAPIVRAIKKSSVVALMCSQHAFSSDHVIREIYVAGDFKKPFIAFELDPTELPDEVRYFLSGFPRVTINVDPGALRSEIARLVATSGTPP